MKNFYYRVKENDTLISICSKFFVPPTVVIGDNNLTCEVYFGQILFIREFNGKAYRVMPKDTLYSISQKFNISESDILINNECSSIYVGQILIV